MITSSHPLYHARLKSDRANEHLCSLKSSIAKFKKDPRPLRTIKEKKGKGEITIRWPPPTPDSWGVILSDFAVNLRGSLDYIAWQLAVINGSGSNRTAFPIFDTIELYRAKATGQIKGILPVAMNEIERMQPYHRGDWPDLHLLSILRELSDKTKHRFFVQPQGAVHMSIPGGGKAGIYIAGILNEPKVFITTPDGRSVPYTEFNPYVTLQVGFETPGISPSTHDITVLDGIYQFVTQGVIPTFTRFFE